jgi:hypothetical protein
VQTLWAHHSLVVRRTVQLVVQVLQVRQVRGVQVLDRLRGNLGHATEAGDHTRKKNDDQIRRIALYARVAQRQDLVGAGCAAHDAVPMQQSGVVDEPQRQIELDFSLEHGSASSVHQARSIRS